jgi:hypothetical protein
MKASVRLFSSPSSPGDRLWLGGVLQAGGENQGKVSLVITLRLRPDQKDCRRCYPEDKIRYDLRADLLFLFHKERAERTQMVEKGNPGEKEASICTFSESNQC